MLNLKLIALAAAASATMSAWVAWDYRGARADREIAALKMAHAEAVIEAEQAARNAAADHAALELGRAAEREREAQKARDTAESRRRAAEAERDRLRGAYAKLAAENAKAADWLDTSIPVEVICEGAPCGT